MHRHTAILCALMLAGCSPSEGSGDDAPTSDPTTDPSSGSTGNVSQDPTGDPSGPGSTSTDPSETEDPASTTDPGSTGDPPDACAGLVGEGFAVDQIAADWTLLDGNGQPVSLHDYCGSVVFIEIGSEW